MIHGRVAERKPEVVVFNVGVALFSYFCFKYSMIGSGFGGVGDFGLPASGLRLSVAGGGLFSCLI